MTNRIHLTIFLLSLSFALSAQTASRTFNKPFNTENRGTIVLDLPGQIEVKVWDNTYIKVEIGVTIPSGNGSILNELAYIGRYNLTSHPDGDVLTITAPNLQKQLKVKGAELREEFLFVVFVPENLKIVLPQAPVIADVNK